MNFHFFLSYGQIQLHSLVKIENLPFMAIIYAQVHVLPICNHLLSETITLGFESHISLGSRSQKIVKGSQHVP